MSRWIASVLYVCLLLGAGAAVAEPCPGQPPLLLPEPLLDPGSVSEKGRQLYAEIRAAQAQGLECVVSGALSWVAEHGVDVYLEGTAVDRLVAAWIFVGAASARNDPSWLARAAEVFDTIERRDLDGPPQLLANSVDARLDAWRGPADPEKIEASADGVHAQSVQRVARLKKEVDAWWAAHPSEPVILEMALYDPKDASLEIRVRGASIRIDRGGELQIRGVRTPDGADSLERSLGQSGRWSRGAGGTNNLLVVLDGGTMVFSLNEATSPPLALDSALGTALELKTGRGLRIDTFSFRVAE